MIRTCLFALLATVLVAGCSPTSAAPADMAAITNTVRTNITKRVIDPRSDQEKQAHQWVAALNLNDPEKAARLGPVIAAHLTEIRKFHNLQIYAINQTNGGKPITLEQQLAADAFLPKDIHENLMTGLRKDLSGEQVDAILDRYTSRRMSLNLEMYQAVVPDLTPEEKAALLAFLQQAREEAVDYKSKEEIVTTFEMYKKKCQDYLIFKGRDWNSLSNAYTKTLEEKKAAGTNAPAASK